MTPQEFDEMVGRLEAEARTKPQAYKSRVVLLALLGYGYIGLVFFALLLVVVLVVSLSLAVRSIAIAGKLLLPVGALMFYILRSLWVSFPSPQGVALTRKTAQPLFNLTVDLRRKLKSPRMHSILLTDDFNAGIVQIPRLGLLGWHKNYLLVGMPLMQALSAEQFRGVLAHEFGHLSGNHGHLSSRVYSLRRTWAQLMETLENQRHWGAAVFTRFLNWYVPYFGAYTFVLARAQEYEADREAARLVGSERFAEALTTISVIGGFLESSFWPAFYKKADHQPEPPSSPFREMARAFQSDIKPVQESALLAQAIETKTGSEDTHPSLADRLAALGEIARPSRRATQTAAQSLLDGNEDELCARLAEQWRENISASWRNRHHFAQEARRQLGMLEERAKSESLTVEEEWDRARFTEDFRDPEQALPLYERVLSLDKNNSGASFAIGRLTIEDDESRAIALIEDAMNANHDLVIPGCHLIHGHLVSKGQKEEAEKYFNRALSQSASYQAASEERSTINPNDRYIAHNLNSEQMQKICQQLGAYAKITAAYLACKKVKHFPEMPLYILGIEPKLSWYKSISTNEASEISTNLAHELSFPGDFYVIVYTKKSAGFKNALAAVPYSLIYERDN